MKNVTAHIITIGDEILYGQTVDTNATFIGQKLTDLGVDVQQVVTISDKKETITSAIENAQADIVLITGGLGPTADDVTKDTLCAYFDDQLALNDVAWKHVQEFYKSRKREISEVNKLQAYLPSKCVCLPNRVGTASGMWFDPDIYGGDKIIVSMPGVPREMKKLISDEVIPRLEEKFDFPIIKHEFVKTVGVPESNLAEKIKGWEQQLPDLIKLAYLPSLGRVKLRLTARGDNGSSIDKVLLEEKSKLLKLVEKYTYSDDDDELEESIAKLLINNNLTISTAESCTGGNVAKVLTSVSGSSNYFQGGIVSYSNEVKILNLGVRSETLEKHGAVSEQIAIEMVEGAHQNFKTDICVSTTGIAGPDGGTTEKPVGTVWIAIKYDGKVKTKLLQVGDLGRDNNIQNTTIAVLNMIRKELN